MHFVFAAARAQLQRTAPLPSPTIPPAPPTSTKLSASSSTSTFGASPTDDRLHISQWSDFSLPSSGIDEEVTDAHRTAAAAVNDCLRVDLAPSTLNTYNSVLQHDLALAEHKLNLKLLPMPSEDLFLAAFGSLLETHGRDLHWSRVKSLKAAIALWHRRNNEACIFDCWTERMRGFWNGLAKRCRHAQVGKEPVSFNSVVSILRAAESSQSVVCVRNSAMIALAFFGVRRGAEVVAMQMRDLGAFTDDGVSFKVRCQKNDPRGLGQVCFVPHIKVLGDASPARLMRRWVTLRSTCQSDSSELAPLFVTTTGANKGGPVSTDSLRKAVAALIGKPWSTHSLRKGGATFYARQGADPNATQQQGGWRTSEIMAEIYTKLSQSEVQRELVKVAQASSFQLELQARVLELGDTSEVMFALPEAKLLGFLNYVNELKHNISTNTLRDTKVGLALKRLCSHPSADIRNLAIELHTLLRAAFMAYQASKRARLK